MDKFMEEVMAELKDVIGNDFVYLFRMWKKQFLR